MKGEKKNKTFLRYNLLSRGQQANTSSLKFNKAFLDFVILKFRKNPPFCNWYGVVFLPKNQCFVLYQSTS
jgi:hypothetical protein